MSDWRVLWSAISHLTLASMSMCCWGKNYGKAVSDSISDSQCYHSNEEATHMQQRLLGLDLEAADCQDLIARLNTKGVYFSVKVKSSRVCSSHGEMSWPGKFGGICSRTSIFESDLGAKNPGNDEPLAINRDCMQCRLARLKNSTCIMIPPTSQFRCLRSVHSDSSQAIPSIGPQIL
jgi:hypothetical protein